MQSVDAVVIGAGINGASTAYNLAKRGYKNVALVERFTIASGGTGKSAAIVRQHYSNEVLVKMVKRSRDVFEFFADEVGGSAGYAKTGWFFFVPEEAVESFKKNIQMQQRLGVKTSIISKAEARSIAPQIDPEDADGIAYEPDSGYADPYDSTMSYVQAARSLGVKLFQSSPVRGICVRQGRVEGVVSDKAEFSTPVVVNASGPWANVIGKMVGITYPIRVTREQEVLLRPETPEQCPMVSVSDMCNAIYFHPFGRDLLIGRGFPKEYEEVDPDNYRESGDPEFVEEAVGRAANRVPALANAPILKGYSGLYDVTPDWHPIICGHQEVAGFFTAVGFSGHGFKLGPAVGESLAELITTGKTSGIDLSVFALERFATGHLFKAAYGGNRA